MQEYSVVANIIAKTDGFLKSVGEAVKKTDELAKNFSTKTKAISEGFTKVGGDLTKKVSLPLVAMGTGATMAFKGFDDSMRNTQALLGDKLGGTIKEQEANLKLLTDEAKLMGATTAHSASASADAMGYMALAGWDTTQIMAGIEPVLNLASAAGMDLAMTSDIVTDAMSMYGMKADEAGRMTDVLASASSSTNTDVAQLGEALKYVGANAAAAGMDIEQTSAFLGILADNGLKGSNAGTTLNAMLRDLKKNAEDGKLAVGDQSVALYDSEGQMRDMTEVMDELIIATAEMSDEQRDQAISSILGQEALKGFNIYAGEGAGAIGELEDGLRDAEGTAKTMADVLEGGLGGSFRGLASATEAVAIAIGEKLAPHIQKAAEFITDLMLKFTKLDDTTTTIIIAVGAVVAAIGPLLLIIGKTLTVVGSIAGAFSGAGASILGMATPIGWVIGIMAALVAAGVLLYKNWDTIKSKAIEVFSNFQPLFDTLKGSFDTFMSSLQPIWESLKELFSSLMPILEMVGALVGSVLITAFGLAISVFSATVSAIGPLVNAIVNIADIVVNMVNVVVALLTGDFAGAWGYLGDIAQSTKDLFFNLFDTISNFIGTFVKTIVDFFHGLYMTLVGNSIIPDIVNGIVDWFKNLGKWSIDLIKGMVTGVVNWFVKLYTDSVANFNKLKTSASTIFNAVKTAIMKPIETAKNKVIDFAKSLFTGARDNFNSLKSSATTIFGNVKDAIVNPIEKARDLVEEAIDKIKGFFTGLKLKIPKFEMPKMPKFKLDGKFSLKPPSVPKIGVDWNAEGGIFSKPTIFNTANAGLQGVGEAGAEAILPLNKNTYAGIAIPIAKELISAMNNNNNNQKPQQVQNNVFHIDVAMHGVNDQEGFYKDLNEGLQSLGVKFTR